MILVKTHLRSSEIHGIGLFADEFISKGTVVWRYKPDFDLKMRREEIDDLSEPAREQFFKYAYPSKNNSSEYILCSDDARFFNHSDSPNCKSNLDPSSEERIDIAVENIQKGEELTCDYRTFHTGSNQRMDTYFLVPKFVYSKEKGVRTLKRSFPLFSFLQKCLVKMWRTHSKDSKRRRD